MKKKFALLCLPALVFCTKVLAEGSRVHIIPQPVSVKEQAGTFTLHKGDAVYVFSPSEEVNSALKLFTKHLASLNIKVVTTSSAFSPSSKKISVAIKENAVIGSEGYELTVSPKNISITANTAKGIFYGLQTLLQLLPTDVEVTTATSVDVPCVEITDYPRFGWRGLMLDVSRHFFTKQEVEKYMDEMAVFKFNTLHLHLSDDNGWRIEIKSLPKLTQVGAWRVKRTGRFGSFKSPEWMEPATDGGFYTQDDIKEMLQYAAERGITILPEIDVPAHSLALIAAYPNLSCTQMPYFVNPGSHFYTEEDNVLCVGNDSVYMMLDKIFTELAQLFPNPYIHVGGDEAYKGFWAKCPKCKKLMADEHLKDVDELQSYFVKRIEKIVNSKGKKLIGWDEILEGGLAPSATVMSWRGMSGGIAAAKMHHQVVMTPWASCYIDLYQGDPNIEPATYGKLLLRTSYEFEPVPDSIDASLILGGQANLWSESVPNFRHAEYMTWPRALAISEVLWSPKSTRNWDGFVSRVEDQFKRFDAEQVKYAPSMYDAVITSKMQKGKTGDDEDTLLIKLGCQINNTDIYYTFDETDLDNFSNKYSGQPLTFPEGANDIKVITYKDGKPLGRQIMVTKKQLEERVNDRPDW
ncbi:MAG TPA: family 20 glycosylhydrolase [Chitinophagaceae bacterium]|nr:family 20 glycosylhydrolase [Chitinophagaceae bacterium]